MDYKAVQELIASMSNSTLTFLEVEADGVRIKIKKETEKIIVKETLQSCNDTISRKPMEVKIEEISEAAEVKKVAPDNGVTITSPIVGVFYGAPSPEKESFVKIGSRVKKGDTLCILEAMKLMNEIDSEYEGEIIEILVGNEQMVEYGQPLFKIKVD